MLHLQLRYMETCGEFMQIDPFIQALLHGMIGIGLIGTLSKLHKWDESAMFFDGSSLGMIPWLWVGRAVLTPFIFVDSRLCLQHCALRDGYNSFTANNRDPTPRRTKEIPSTSFERPLRRKCDYHSLPTGRVGTPGMNPLLFFVPFSLFFATFLVFPLLWLHFLLSSPGWAGVRTSTRCPWIYQDEEGCRNQSQEGSII